MAAFIFEYSNGQLSDSKYSDSLPEDNGKKNNDKIPLYVICKRDGHYMDFLPGRTNSLDGHWCCPKCKAAVDEVEVYKKLDAENRDYLLRNDLL